MVWEISIRNDFFGPSLRLLLSLSTERRDVLLHAVIQRLKSYLGFMHSEETYKPSLACDMMELYRHLVDDFFIQYCRDVQRKDFVVKTEKYVSNRQGKREYLSDSKTNDLTRRFYAYLDWKVKIPRIKHGNKSSIETLITEEASLLAMYLRDEKKDWHPRIGITLQSLIYSC